MNLFKRRIKKVENFTFGVDKKLVRSLKILLKIKQKKKQNTIIILFINH